MKLKLKMKKGEWKKAFKLEDKFALRKKADSNIIATMLPIKILADINYEEAEKSK